MTPLIRGRVLGLGIANTGVLVGLDAYPVSVEVTSTRGPSFFQMVGLAEAVVRESRVRVTSSLARLGVLLDEYAITVNLSPADLKKTGAILDLSIAIAVLSALGQLSPESVCGLTLLGELSLDGRIQPIRGVLPLLSGLSRSATRGVIVPAANRAEAGLSRGVAVWVADELGEVIAHLRGERPLPRVPEVSQLSSASTASLDLSEVRGQVIARRALEIAAAGHHNLLFVGPPGGGKTLLARTLPGLLPPLSFDEAIEVTAIHSVAGLVDPKTGMVERRPFRAPHHSVSEPGLVGGGENPRPGEVTLAHLGVLFLDELAEFRRRALEALRQPLEDGWVQITRARATVRFPARPLLVAATNPCPCGYFGHPRLPCRCRETERRRYLARLSGPLLDRIDLHCGVPPVEPSQLISRRPSESSETVRSRVFVARARQWARHTSGEVTVPTNAQLSLGEAERVCSLDAQARALLERAARRLGVSARAYLRILRVARSIADLEEQATVSAAHVAEAIQGRILERESPDERGA